MIVPICFIGFGQDSYLVSGLYTVGEMPMKIEITTPLRLHYGAHVTIARAAREGKKHENIHNNVSCSA